MPMRSGTHMHAHTRKHAHTDQYVILIAFPQLQWFRERSLILLHTYIACLLNTEILFLHFTSNDWSRIRFVTCVGMTSWTEGHCLAVFCIYI